MSTIAEVVADALEAHQPRAMSRGVNWDQCTCGWISGGPITLNSSRHRAHVVKKIEEALTLAVFPGAKTIEEIRAKYDAIIGEAP